jgi:beta-N-acetylhexosaminidase
MSLEEKIGQLFFIASRTTADGQKRLAIDASLEDTLKKYKPGGFILFAENLDNIPQTVSFIKDIKQTSAIPMFVGIDEEGGIVTRLNKAVNLHSTVMPAPYEIGQTNNAEYAFEASKAIAEEIKSLGFNLDFAPVADVFSNPNNKIIGKRSYGSDAELASKMVAQAVKGTMNAGIIPVLKHFPGHGDTLQDSHTGAAIVENDLDRLRKVEFLPFRAGLDSGAEIVMTAHVLTPKITQNGLPATLSKPIIQGILRDELGFDGLIITDGLEMSAISAFYPEEEAVVLAVEAGVDMLLLPKDFEKSYNAILAAVKNGRLTEQRIDESVRRILKIKLEYKISEENKDLNPEKVLGSKEHKALADEIKSKSSK